LLIERWENEQRRLACKHKIFQLGARLFDKSNIAQGDAELQ